MTTSNPPDFSCLELGRTHDPIAVDTSEAVREACLALISQTHRNLMIVTRHLDPVLFDNAETSSAVREFVLRSRRTRMRVLVKDPAPAVREGHRLIDLAQRLSSFIEMRVSARQHAEYNAAFLIADEVGVVHRDFADRYEATVSFGDRKLAGELVHQFEEMWSSARSDPSFRKAMI